VHVIYRYRVKSLNGLLNRQARAVNFVWNYCNDRQKDALRFGRKSHTGFDLINLASGSSKELGLHSGTIDSVCRQYVKSRTQAGRPYLRYRGEKSLGWVPVRGRSIERQGDDFLFNGRLFRVFNSRDLPAGKIKDGTNFSRDSRGNWYLNIAIEIDEAQPRQVAKGVGIDLGLKDFATFSNGEKIENPRHFRQLEGLLGRAQRAGKKRRVRKIHARISAKRRDFIHKLTHRIVREFDYIAVGNVSAAVLAKTRMAKSVLDASWSSFRIKLAYKAVKHGAWFEEVDERFTSQTCSSCGALPDSRPKGIAGLGIREWVCSDCGAAHDRDTNAALNILRRGHATLAEGTFSQDGKAMPTKGEPKFNEPHPFEGLT
jgi:IS605 OrfB family transposase